MTPPHQRGWVAASSTLLLALSWSAEGRADVTGWLHTGGGVLGWQGGPEGELTASALMTADLGVGTTPRAPFIVGGVFRVMPVFAEGVDLALSARFATAGFQSDVIGFAFDAGGYYRYWGAESGGFIGQAILGGPFGLQLTAIGMGGSNDTFGFGGTLGIDFVRLTIGRRHFTEWWPNIEPSDPVYAQ
jgi:hypothetical protein